jgi:hypothetical protein
MTAVCERAHNDVTVIEAGESLGYARGINLGPH